jgi:hypothetical protein
LEKDARTLGIPSFRFVGPLQPTAAEETHKELPQKNWRLDNSGSRKKCRKTSQSESKQRQPGLNGTREFLVDKFPD